MNGCYHKQGQGLKAFGGSPTPKLSPQAKPGTTPPPHAPTPDSSMTGLISVRQLSLFIKWRVLVQ